MRILSYHIENYGKLQNYDGHFEPGLTCFCEENGFGKSTLASFLKAMFYGLPSYTVSSKGFNDRQKYYPFNAGKFGGNLTFSHAGKTYRIERFFDKKSSRGDEVRVYCNGAPFDGFGEEIGKALFGLDEESFKKTIFITADEIDISSTHSINEKLNHTVEGIEETNDFPKVIERLETAKKALKAARGNRDKISEKKEEITSLNEQKVNAETMSKQLSLEYVEREQLSKEIQRLEQATKVAAERNLVLQKWETLDSMTKQKEERKLALQQLKEKYPQGIPSEEDGLSLKETWENSNRLRGTLQATNFPSHKEEALQRLEEKFKNGIPMSVLIEENQQKIVQLSTIETEKNRLKNRQESEQERQLASKYAVKIPSEAELQTQRALAEEYKKKDRELKERSAILLQTKTQPTRGKSKREFYLLLMGIALLVVGIPLLFVTALVGIGLSILGGIFLIVAGVVKFVKPTMPPSNGEMDLIPLQVEMRGIEEKIRAFTIVYGYYSEAGALFDLAKLEEDVQAYKAQVVQKKEREHRALQLEEESKRIEGEIVYFLQTYGVATQPLQTGLNQLQAEMASYASLRADREQSQTRKTEILAALKEGEERISKILQKYHLSENVATMDGLNVLFLDQKRYVTLENEMGELEGAIVEYQRKNGLDERPNAEKEDVDFLHDQLFTKRKALVDCDKRITETERFVERFSDVDNLLSIAEEQLMEYQQKYAVLSDTIAALKGAEQSLKDKYVAPIKRSFSHYAAPLEQVFGGKVDMDQDFRIVFEQGGESRSEKHLSAGERSLCALCLRLALIDNMYEAEQPFVVMDDPFVHLDETHMLRTKTLLKELSKNRQILYFCCHESRRV